MDGDDGGGDGGRISSNLHPPFPSRPGITYPVRAPALTPTTKLPTAPAAVIINMLGATKGLGFCCQRTVGGSLCSSIIGVRAGARTGYVIPGRDGNGGWRFGEILPPSSPSSTTKNRVFGENGILRFVTHSRAMNFLASAYESYGRGGSFLF